MNTFNATEAAAYLRVDIKTLQRWDRKGCLVSARTDTNRRVYTKQQLDDFLDQIEDKTRRVKKPRAPEVQSATTEPVGPTDNVAATPPAADMVPVNPNLAMAIKLAENSTGALYLWLAQHPELGAAYQAGLLAKFDKWAEELAEARALPRLHACARSTAMSRTSAIL